MSHLGRRLSALIDGELSDAERDQAHTHLVSCEACRSEAAVLRTIKRRIHELGEAPADGDLTSRLMALEGLPALAPPRSRLPGAARARAAFSAFSGGAVDDGWDELPSPLGGGGLAPAGSVAASAFARGHLHTRYLVVGAVAALAVGLGAASFAAGGEQHLPGPTVTPEVDSYNFQHAATFGELPTFGSATPSPAASPVPSPARQTVGPLQP
jgi:anti-sigma factor RsiW